MNKKEKIIKANEDYFKESTALFDKRQREWEKTKADRRKFVAKEIKKMDKEVIKIIVEDYVGWRFPDEYALEIEQYLRKFKTNQIKFINKQNE